MCLFLTLIQFRAGALQIMELARSSGATRMPSYRPSVLLCTAEVAQLYQDNLGVVARESGVFRT